MKFQFSIFVLNNIENMKKALLLIILFISINLISFSQISISVAGSQADISGNGLNPYILNVDPSNDQLNLLGYVVLDLELQNIAEIINNTNVGSAKEVATKGVLGLSTSAILYIKMATSIASVVAATAKGLSALGGGSVSAPSNTGGGGGGESTTAVAPTAGPSLFGQANTGSQVNAGDGSNNITVTAIVSETEITASQNHINNIQQNSVL